MKPMKKLSALLITLALAGLSGCGPSSADDALASIKQGVVMHQTAFYGAEDGTMDGPVNLSQDFVATKIDGWEDGSNIYAMKIKCSNGHTAYYGVAGSTPHGTQSTLNIPAGKWVNKIEVSVDGSNILRGIHMYTNDTGTPGRTWGDMTFNVSTVLSPEMGSGVKFTDMSGYVDQLTYLTFVSASFSYITSN